MNRPIGSEWVSVDTNGHFIVSGERIRFLGVNFAGDSPFMPTNNAGGVARRLAKYGVNNVRFHHMDASWAYGGGLLAYTATRSTNFNAGQLDRLHYLIARLKEQGIYANINLLVGRNYRAEDGLGPEVTSLDWKDQHILGFFYRPALELQKDYATKLLGATNRHTGLTLARDPAVAFVEIINENGIVQKWAEGSLDRLPARYATNLLAKWNTWLAARYTNSASMLEAWKVVNEALGPNVLVNGAFSNGLANWHPEQHQTARAVFGRTYEFTNNQPSVRILVTNASTAGWHIQFNQSGVRLVSNQTYTISFQAKASAAVAADASVQRAHTDWANLGSSQRLDLTTQWKMFTNTFQAFATESNARVGFGNMGDKLATFWFADVRLQRGGQIGVLPAGSALETRNVPIIARSGPGYTGTSEARRDWAAFLCALENDYYAEMVAHLRTNLGYGGLVFGTIMANSPASVQARLDVVDGHSYWQHPEFPGTPWDSVNWIVPNVSMVTTLGNDNTLAGLARQRIHGRPFTVTEYQHPSPNYYGAEGPLLLAAYGGLQDWDGLWLFDYGQGNPAVTMGYVRGFFEIGQHTTKMANLLVAANLFRRGDVSAATKEYRMALPLERELELLKSAGQWNIFSASQLGVPGKLAFASRISTDVGPNPTGLSTPPAEPIGGVVSSDTGELRWDTSVAGKGLVTVNSPRTRSIVGFADNQTVQLGDLSIRPGTTRLGWCTVSATLRRGEGFTNDCNALIVATGWWENTGQIWKDSSKTSVGNQWGGPPVLVESVPFTLTIPVGTNQVKIWALNETGSRKAQLPIGGSATNTVFTATNTGTIWYEMEVSRWTASFDLWRMRYFSEVQLQDTSISGEGAVPDGDGVANLWKYHVGLYPNAPVPANVLPTGQVVEVSNHQFLAMTYVRDRLTEDVVCEGEVSPNLKDWYGGAGYTASSVAGLSGDLERVTVRSLSPLRNGEAQHLRLRLERDR